MVQGLSLDGHFDGLFSGSSIRLLNSTPDDAKRKPASSRSRVGACVLPQGFPTSLGMFAECPLSRPLDGSELEYLKCQEAIFVQINFAGRMNFMSAVPRPTGRDPRRAWHPALPSTDALGELHVGDS